MSEYELLRKSIEEAIRDFEFYSNPEKVQEAIMRYYEMITPRGGRKIEEKSR